MLLVLRFLSRRRKRREAIDLYVWASHFYMPAMCIQSVLCTFMWTSDGQWWQEIVYYCYFEALRNSHCVALDLLLQHHSCSYFVVVWFVMLDYLACLLYFFLKCIIMPFSDVRFRFGSFLRFSLQLEVHTSTQHHVCIRTSHSCSSSEVAHA